jgi:uncharacterized Zn-binding protein involved in type VI secretion
MPAAVRLGDVNSAGGAVLTASANVTINGKPAATVSSLISAHPPCPRGGIHCAATIVTGSNSVLVNNKPLAYVGSLCSCGHTMATGSPSVQVGLGGSGAGVAAAGTETVAGVRIYRDPFVPENRQAVEAAAGPEASGKDDPGEDILASKVSCEQFGAKLTDANYNARISRHYTLANLSIRAIFPHRIQAQHGLTEGDIACNLANLATRVLDPVRDRFPGFNVNSGFRQAKNRSDHETGCAVDIQWPGLRMTELLARCVWVRDNIPGCYQIIFERPRGMSGSGWMHVAYRTGQRAAGTRFTLTFLGGSSYVPGFVTT